MNKIFAHQKKANCNVLVFICNPFHGTNEISRSAAPSNSAVNKSDVEKYD
jgi:hypothetical protein